MAVIRMNHLLQLKETTSVHMPLSLLIVFVIDQLYQVKAKNAFMEVLFEKVYLHPLFGLPDSPLCLSFELCSFNVKEAPHAWFDCFRLAIQAFEFQ